jgi:hypothetical protein
MSSTEFLTPTSHTEGSVGLDNSLQPTDENPMMPALNQLNSFLKLPQNWDSYGGEAPTSQALNAAYNFLVSIQGQLGGAGKSVTPSDVAPLPSGGIHLAWRTRRFEIEIEFDADGTANYLLADKRADIEVDKEGSADTWEALIALVASVLYG